MIGYETTFILRPDITDDAQKALIEKFKGIIQAHGGQTLTVEEWGKRKLAYAIQRETRGVYVYMLYTGNNSLVAELERNLRITEQVIRFLTVHLGKDFDPAKFKRRANPNAAPVGPVGGFEPRPDEHRPRPESRPPEPRSVPAPSTGEVTNG